MIIPLGPEDREVRRIPWITAAILVANVLAFVLVSYSPWAQEADRRAERSSREFLGFWVQHPWLPMPDEYARYVGKARAAREAEQIGRAQEILARRGFRPNPAAAEADGAELDRRAAAWVKAMQATPSWALGFVPSNKTAVSLLTSMFMHGGWWHLLGNMLIFLMTAPLLEDRYGRLVFPLFYLAAGTAAAYAFAVQAPDALVPLIGASGAIAGVMGAFCVRLFRTRMVYLVLPIPIFFFLRFRVRVPAWVVFPFWFLEQLALNAIAPDAGVAWAAHIGGFLFGVAFAFGMKAASVEERWIHPAIEKEIGWQQHPALTRAAELRDARDFEGARAQLKAGLAAEPNNVDGWRALFDLSVDLHDAAEAARAATRRVELLASRGEAELASIAVAEALDHVAEDELPVRFWLAAAGVRERIGDARAAYDAYEAVAVRFPHDALAARALVKMAEIAARAGDPGTAWRLVRLAQRHPACLEGWREAADRILVSLPPGSAPTDPDAPIPTRGGCVPRGARSLPAAAVYESAIVAPAPPPPRRVERPPAAAHAPAGSPPPLPGPEPAAVPPAAARARRRLSRPALAWSVGGFAAVAIGTTAVVLWEPWARTAPTRSTNTDTLVAPAVVPAATVPAAVPPAPKTTTAAGPEVPLGVSFRSPFAAGQLIVQVNGRTVLTKDFDFGKESGGGALDEVAVVASGAADVRVWVTSRDRTTRAYGTLAASIPEGAPRSLEVTLTGAQLALALK